MSRGLGDVYKRQTENYEGVALPRTGERFAYIILSMLPPVLVVVILQRWFIKGLIQTEK